MKNVKSVLLSCGLFLLLPIVFHIPEFALSGVLYPALKEWFPSVFLSYNPITEPEQYEIAASVLYLLVAALSLFMIAYFQIRFDNSRMEYMISKTEGMYTFREGISLYYPRYLVSDAVASAVAPLPLFIAEPFIPQYWPETIPTFVIKPVEYIFSFITPCIDILGFIAAYLFIASVLFASRALGGALSIRAWRGIWLSDI